MTSIVEFSAADLPAVRELEEACFAPTDRWSAQSWDAELSASDHLVLGVLDNATDGLLAAAAFSSIAEDSELLRVMTAPSARGRGLARALLVEGAKWASQLGASRMLLEVESANQAALGLYEAMGFEQLTRRIDYYGRGRDALIMARELNAEGQYE